MKRGLLTAAAILLTAAGSVEAGTSGWIHFENGPPGEATDPGHEGWIDVSGFQIAGPLNPHQPGTFAVVKSTDRATPALVLASAQGTRFPSVVLDLTYSTGSLQSPVRVTLKNAIVTVLGSTSSGNRPIETIGLSFETVTYTYATSPSVHSTVTRDFIRGTGWFDNDGDGLSDAWETANGLSVGTHDAQLDADHDGFTNLQEFLLGTQPNSAASFFQATLTPASALGMYLLAWPSVPGVAYHVEWSPDLVTPFTPVQSVTASGPTTTAAVSVSGNVGFYRVRLP